MEKDFKEECFQRREQIEILKRSVRSIIQHDIFKGEQQQSGQHSEMKANIMFTFRHLEDARMRLGKVIQAYDGGTSVYPR